MFILFLYCFEFVFILSVSLELRRVKGLISNLGEQKSTKKQPKLSVLKDRRRASKKILMKITKREKSFIKLTL